MVMSPWRGVLRLRPVFGGGAVAALATGGEVAKGEILPVLAAELDFAAGGIEAGGGLLLAAGDGEAAMGGGGSNLELLGGLLLGKTLPAGGEACCGCGRCGDCGCVGSVLEDFDATGGGP